MTQVIGKQKFQVIEIIVLFIVGEQELNPLK